VFVFNQTHSGFAHKSFNTLQNTEGFQSMPYVNIKITNEGVTKEQKRQLVAGVTELLVTILGKNPATTVVVIDEVDTENWGIDGRLVSDRRNSEP
jgi:4-oxalocrotonate tautomerase